MEKKEKKEKMNENRDRKYENLVVLKLEDDIEIIDTNHLDPKDIKIEMLLQKNEIVQSECECEQCWEETLDDNGEVIDTEHYPEFCECDVFTEEDIEEESFEYYVKPETQRFFNRDFKLMKGQVRELSKKQLEKSCEKFLNNSPCDWREDIIDAMVFYIREQFPNNIKIIA